MNGSHKFALRIVPYLSVYKLKSVQLAVAHMETNSYRYSGDIVDVGTIAPVNGHADGVAVDWCSVVLRET